MSPSRPLTRDQIVNLQAFITEKFPATVEAFSHQPFTVPLALVREWQASGLIDRRAKVADFFNNVYIFHRLKKAIEYYRLRNELRAGDPADFQRLIRHVTTYIPTPIQRWMRGYLKHYAASRVEGVTEAERQAIRTVLSKHSGRRKLFDELFRVFRGTYEGYPGDVVIDNFAYDETQEARHLACAYHLLCRYGPDLLVEKTPHPDACALCKATHLEPDGVTHKVFRLRDFLRHGPEEDYSERQIGPFRWRFRLDELLRSRVGLPAVGAPVGLVHSLCRCSGPDLVFPQ